MSDIDVINILIKNLRLKKSLTQFQISKLLNIPSSTYSMIETGRRSVSNDILIPLSNILDFDFVTFSKNIHKYKTLEHYLLATELLQLIYLDDADKFTYILRNSPLINEFDYGEPQIIRTYCEVLSLIKVENNIDLAYDTCIDFLKIKNLENFQPKMNMPNQYYCIILNLGYCLHQKNLHAETITLYTTLIGFLENLYFNPNIPFINTPSFHRKYYIICLNNIADVHFTLNNFDIALQMCNKGILKSSEYNVLIILPTLLILKVEILCKLDDYATAKSTYVQFKSLCEITSKMSYFETYTNKFIPLYPKLFIE